MLNIWLNFFSYRAWTNIFLNLIYVLSLSSPCGYCSEPQLSTSSTFLARVNGLDKYPTSYRTFPCATCNTAVFSKQPIAVPQMLGQSERIRLTRCHPLLLEWFMMVRGRGIQRESLKEAHRRANEYDASFFPFLLHSCHNAFNASIVAVKSHR